MRIKALIIAALLALGVLGTTGAQAQGVEVCYDYNIQIADQSAAAADCIVLPPA